MKKEHSINGKQKQDSMNGFCTIFGFKKYATFFEKQGYSLAIWKLLVLVVVLLLVHEDCCRSLW